MGAKILFTFFLLQFLSSNLDALGFRIAKYQKYCSQKNGNLLMNLVGKSADVDLETVDKLVAPPENRNLVSQYFMQEPSSVGSADSKPFQDAKQYGWQVLKTLPLPYGKNEPWRQTNMRNLFSHPFSSDSLHFNGILTKELISEYIDENCQDSCIIFVDGIYRQELSRLDKVPIGVEVRSLLHVPEEDKSTEKALRYIPDMAEIMRDSFGSDALTALNLAQMKDGLLINVKDSVTCDTPIQALFLTSQSENAAAYYRMVVKVGDGSSLMLKQSHMSLSGSVAAPTAQMINSNTRILVGSNAKCQHFYSQELSESVRHLEVLSAATGKESNYEVTILQMGAKVARVNLHVDIGQSLSNMTVNGVSLAGEKQSIDLHSSILHNCESANSNQQHRNVIADRGESIFKGRIRIPKHAQMSDAQQLCRTLMLGDAARVVAMPTLEITADNVACSHGASIADLDENSMFYLASRGINRQESRQLLLRGFVLEVLDSNLLGQKGLSRLLAKLECMNPITESIASGQHMMSL